MPGAAGAAEKTPAKRKVSGGAAPKSGTKAAVGAGAPASGGAPGGAGGKGRPKRNVISTAEDVCRSFLHCDRDNQSFWGDGSKAYIRWMERLHKDLGELLKAETDEKTFDELQALEKKVLAIVNVCKGAKQHSFEAADFAKGVEIMANYLRMEPVVKDPVFPQVAVLGDGPRQLLAEHLLGELEAEPRAG